MEGGRDPSIQSLLARLASSERDERLRAAWALGERGEPQPAILQRLEQALVDADPDVRGTAAEALGRLGSRRGEALSVLLPLLAREEDPTVRARTAYGLGRAGLNGALAVPALMELARKDTTHACDTALWALGEIGASPALTVPLIAGALHGPRSDLRWMAAKALGRIGPAAAGAVEILSETLHDLHPFVGEMAAWALGEIGRPAPAAVQALKLLARSRLAGPRREALLALRAFGSEARTAAAGTSVEDAVQRPASDLAGLLRRVQEGQTPEATEAAFLVGELAGKAAAAVPVLARLLDSPEPGLRDAVIGAMGKIAPHHRPAARALAARLRQAPADQLAALDWALGLAGEGAAAAIPAVRRQLASHPGVDHLDLEVRYHAAWALARLDPAGAQVVPDLAHCLDDPDSDVRAIAAENVGFLGAAEASEALHPLLGDRHGIVRHRAGWALRRIAMQQGVVLERQRVDERRRQRSE